MSSADMAQLEEHCTGCLQSPLDVSLVLSCHHRLCLDCSARALCSHSGSDHIVTCPTCNAVTDVDPAAAQHLCEHRATLREPSSLVGTVHQPALRWPQSSGSPVLGGSQPLGSVQNTPVGDVGLKITGPSFGISAAPSNCDGSELCGQCQARPAELDCWQCGEQFCGSCSSGVHRAGRMKEHRLTPLLSVARSGAIAGSVTGAAVPAVVGGASSPPSPRSPRSPTEDINRSQRVHQGRCPMHPDQPLQFFCMDCESECICAECAVEAAHSGRDVKSVRKAYAELAPHVDDTLEGLRSRHDEQTKTKCDAEALKADLDMVIGKGKQSIQEAFRQLRTSLSQKEVELIAGIDVCEQTACQTISGRIAPAVTHSTAIREAQMALQKVDINGDEVKALNSFASARIVVDHLVDPLTGVDGSSVVQLIDELCIELRGALQQQTGSIASLASRAGEIRRNGAAPGAFTKKG